MKPIKRVVAIAAFISAAITLGLAGEARAKDAKTVEQTLMQLERDWTAALLKNDGATLGKILADSWGALGTLGATTKAQYLADLKSGDMKMESQTIGEMKVQVFGDVAVVTGSDDEKSSYKAKDTSGHYVWTDVWVKKKGQWQAVASQITLMSPK
jgi:ketosteroid isomerase-like protein